MHADNQVHIVDNLSDLKAFESQWRRMLGQTRSQDIFSSFSELLGTIIYRRDAGTWRCHILTSNNEIRCAIPATLKTVTHFGIRFPTLDLGINYTSEPIGDYSNDSELNSLVDSFFGQSPKIAFINFSKLSHQSSKRISKVLAAKGYNCHVIPSGAKYYFDTSKSIAEITARMPKSFRRTFTRQRNRMEQRWTLTFNAVRSSDLDKNLALFDDFQLLERSGWKGKAGSALSDQESMKAYFKNMIETRSPENEISWYRLCANDKPIAMYLCSCTGGTVWAHKTAYDAEFSSYSPGNDLLLRILEHESMSPEITILNMVTGPEWLKKWRPEELPIWNLRVFSTGFKGRFLYWLLRLKVKIQAAPD